MKFLLTVILWFPDQPLPALTQVIADDFITLEQCELTAEGWRRGVKEVILKDHPEWQTDEVVLAFCSKGEGLEESFTKQTSML